MTRLFVALPAAVVLFAAPVFAQTATVGIVALGEDAAAAGELQRAVGLRLDGVPSLERRPAASVVAGLGEAGAQAPALPAALEAATQRAQGLVARAVDAYYDEQSATALSLLGQVDEIDRNAGPLPAPDRIAFHLWKTAIALSLDDDGLADAEARAALVVDPGLKVDLSVFPPDVKNRVEKVRSRGLRQVTVVLQGLPDGAAVAVDGRSVGASFKVPVGRHTLGVTAPGHRSVRRAFSVSRDRALAVELPVRLSDADRELFNRWLAGEALDAEAHEALVTRAGADVLVILGPDPEQRMRAVVVTSRDRDVRRSEPAGADPARALGDWVVEQASAIAGKPVAVNRNREGGFLETNYPERKWELEADAGIVLSQWNRNVTDDTSGRFSHAINGVGSVLTVRGARQVWVADVEWSFVTYDASTVSVIDGTGTEVATTEGGYTNVFLGHVGARWTYKQRYGRPDAISAAGGIGFFWEQHRATDATLPGIGPLGVYTDYRHNGGVLWVGGQFPFPVGRRFIVASVRAHARFGAVHYDPVGTYGEDPTGFMAGGRTGLSYRGDKWGVDGDFTLLIGEHTFDGTGTAPTSPALVNARIGQQFLTARIAIQRVFW